MDVLILPALDLAILAAPFLAILGMAMVGLDERFANSGRKPGVRRCFCEVDDRGSFLSDPDGRAWFTAPHGVIEGTLCPKPARGHGNDSERERA